MKKQLRFFVLVLVLLLLGSFGVYGMEGYQGYTYNSYDNSVPSQIGYTAESLWTASDVSEEWKAFRAPTDMYMTTTGELYLLDSGNGRVAVMNADFQPVHMIDTFLLPNGQETKLLNPAGLFVDKEKHLYIADTGNARIIRCDQEGHISRVYTRPQNETFQKAIEFRPVKVVVDSSGYLYALVEGVFEGAVVYNTEGGFECYFGSNRVETTLQLLSDMLWKKLMTSEQTTYLAKYVPDEFSNFDIDEEGFIYTCTASAAVKADKVKRLNASGVNVLRGEGNYGERETVWVKGQMQKSQLIDVQSENGYIRVLDKVYGRVFEYDKNGELLLIFGGLGQQIGTFRNPVALEAYKDKLYVLDGVSGSITVFAPTAFGVAVHKAVELYNEGLYGEARASWEYILSLDCNYELAYNGIGKSASADGLYEEAAAWFRLANNRQAESDAYAECRAQWIQDKFPWIVLGIVLLIVGSWLAWRWYKKRAVHNKEPEERLMYSLLHPNAAFEERKRKKAFGWWMPAIMSLLLFVSSMLNRQVTGFRFNMSDSADVKIWIVFVGTAVLFAAVVTVNWAVCTLLDGKGHLIEIANVGAYALMPYVVSVWANVMLSQVLLIEEGTYMQLLSVLALIWSMYILFGGLSAIHEYSFSKMLASLFFTIAGLFILAFILLLSISLLQQTWSFFSAVITETFYRIF